MDKDKRVKLQDIQQSLDEARNAAEEEGLQIIVSWKDKKGNLQSVKLNKDDRVGVSVKS